MRVAVGSYRWRLLGADKVVAVQLVDCSDDADAMTWAERLLQGRPELGGVEAWERTRFVGRAPRADG
jgi:hypothetical protein